VTVIPGVCYVCGQPKAEHTAEALRLGCTRPAADVSRNLNSADVSRPSSNEQPRDEEYAF
jgi:hypothetical protein